MTYRFWVSNLQTDEGQYVSTADDLTKLIEQMLAANVMLEDIGISLEYITAEESNG